MNQPSTPAAGKFSGAAQSKSFNHGHASQMAYAAARRLQTAKTLQGASGPLKAPSGGFKDQIAQAVTRAGRAAGPQHVADAIDGLAQAGKLTPLQAKALKAHNGPLVGPQGQATQAAIMQHMLARPV